MLGSCSRLRSQDRQMPAVKPALPSVGSLFLSHGCRRWPVAVASGLVWSSSDVFRCDSRHEGFEPQTGYERRLIFCCQPVDLDSSCSPSLISVILRRTCGAKTTIAIFRDRVGRHIMLICKSERAIRFILKVSHMRQSVPGTLRPNLLSSRILAQRPNLFVLCPAI